MEKQPKQHKILAINPDNISLLKDHLSDGIKILSKKLTKFEKPQHPLYIAYRDRGLRYTIISNKYVKKSTIDQFHPKAYTLKQLEILFDEINEWAEKCVSDIAAIYNEKYLNRFRDFVLPKSVLTVKPDEDSLAILQNKIKTQLENLINFLIHRIAYYEEFGEYDNIMNLEILIDKYTYRFFKLLYNIGISNSAELYSTYLDPLSFFILLKISSELKNNPEADIDFIIDKSKSVIRNLSRVDFDFNSNVPIGLADAENINSKIRVIKDDFEREYFSLDIGKLPEKFRYTWDKEIEGFHGYQYSIDLMEALNRLPVNMRDIIVKRKAARKKSESSRKGQSKTTKERNTKIHAEYKKYHQNGKTDTWIYNKLAKKHGLAAITIKDILSKSP